MNSGWRVTGTGVGDSGFGFSAISRGSLEPAAEGRTANARMAVTRHLNRFALREFQPLSAYR